MTNIEAAGRIYEIFHSLDAWYALNANGREVFDLAINALTTIDQIRLERDVAIKQLKELGYPEEVLNALPIISKIKKLINSGNRGTADYFIVDKIEELINEYEKH